MFTTLHPAPIAIWPNDQDTLFGRRMTPAERLRQHQRSLQKAQRELERERAKLEQQEKKTMADIKKNAKAGNMNACKILAKDLVRTRRYMQKFTQMRVQLQAVSLRMQTLRSNESMAQAMRGATRAMGQMNRSLNLPQIQRIMNEFEKESATMDMKEEMMSDAVDDAMEDEDEGEGEDVESDKILREVFDEIGMGMNEALASAPTANPMANEPLQSSRVAVAEGGPGPSSGPPSAGGGGSKEEDDLQRRLDMLRRD
ncbi:class E Vps protein of the ESCRT-III complex, Did4p [Trichosporon asahii var. asahii CBS 8904]|uniref:Class E Vps protein of the ESCRT-III complex, Did4p n=2 Tax=Trichosporon asahii var. asahii TaxID=189963 RepID=K1VSE8_TRIAC|nr:class E Vps protein of the ESCRT-III complex, Did4p [Trichosporon asahii var. asahii CBS 2479]EJT47293.1 class E Vps protein of the ESCRT-III complex, Did4p [Trichosporon asahii var. asahii CBS 2479]EKD03516.1 class E Vps protein of the ESCRT-III complex, Did4p [Trichosporon asahii var. asahii CBS 8904]